MLIYSKFPTGMNFYTSGLANPPNRQIMLSNYTLSGKHVVMYTFTLNPVYKFYFLHCVVLIHMRISEYCAH